MRFLSLPIVLAAVLAACATVVNPVTGKSERTVMDEQPRSPRAKGAPAGAGRVRRVRRPAAAGLRQRRRPAAGARSRTARDLQWTFTVLDSPEINAFALPGGYVYVTRGIMAYLDSEADLAGVIGHEIGHVTARHGAQRATRQQTAGPRRAGAPACSAPCSACGDLARARCRRRAAAGYVATYSREQELQADQLGAEYLARNRYDPRNMVDVIGVLKDQERFAADAARAEGQAPPAGSNWLSSHPTNEKRLRDITRDRRRATTRAATATTAARATCRRSTA